jgi:D-amino-acid dehydrogenase
MTGRAVVVGAGAIGMASAYFLQRSGWSVTVIDKGEVGRACSYGNACLIVPSHSDPIPGPGVIGEAFRHMLSRTSPFYVRPRFDPGLFKWSLRFRRYCNADAARRGHDALAGLSVGSLALYQELTTKKEADFYFERKGLLELYLTREGAEKGRRECEKVLAHGFPARFLTRQEVLDFEPSVSPAVEGGLFIESEAHGFSYGYVRALAKTVEDRGGRMVLGREASRLVIENGRVRGVELSLPRETIDADVVVLAAGSWSRALLAPLGIDLPLQPAKGYSCTIDAFEGAPKVPLLVKERRVIVTPLEGRVRFGGTLELTGFDSTIDRTRYGAVIRAAREVLKTPFPLVNEEPWSGLRPVTPDGIPVIDRLESPAGLILATGHAMLGFTQSPMTGKLVAELANGDTPSVPVEPFRLSRF